MEKSKLELENFGGILYIVFPDEFGTPTDEQIAQYLDIDVNTYKDMLVKFGCLVEPIYLMYSNLYGVRIDGWTSITVFAGRLNLKIEEFDSIVETQFNANISGDMLYFKHQQDFEKFKEWYITTRSVAKILPEPPEQENENIDIDDFYKYFGMEEEV